MSVEPLLRRRLDGLAGDVGRLRQRLDGESYGGFLVGRIADHIEALDCMLGPTAAEIYRDNIAFGAGDDEAAVSALAEVDTRCRKLRGLLGAMA